jgi:hypothetical protein
MRTRNLIVAMTFSLAIAAPACGGNDNELSDDSVAAIGRIEAICDDWRLGLEERGKFPVEDFDPEDPDPRDLRTVGNYFASGQSTSNEGIAALRELAVPAEIQSKVDALVAAMEREFDVQKTQHAAAQAGDVAAFKATLKDAASTNRVVKRAADDLGAKNCSL